MMNPKEKGSRNYFDINWHSRAEKHPYFTRGNPASQLQLAFKNHYELFQRTILKGKTGKCLEVGCGRGNMSLYFADKGWDCTLLDISENAINVAKTNFRTLGLKASFLTGDGESLPFENESFDCVFSIGLLEHFKDPEKTITEQFRILKKDGIFIGYVVPERLINVQTFFKPLNFALSFFKKFGLKESSGKNQPEELYRSNYNSDFYIEICSKAGFSQIDHFGIFPIPLISYSAIYPFTPLPDSLEKLVTSIDESFLNLRSRFFENPWKCSEIWGQAFVVWCVK